MHILPGVLIRRDPVRNPAPLVFDIPRSGSEYPRDFRSSAPFDAVHRSISMYVEELYSGAPEAGATWLYASFPNAYIDANRHELDIDPELIEGEWPGKLEPTEKSRLGIGLIHRGCGRGDVKLHDRKLTVAEVRHRIDAYYRPYHGELARILKTFREQNGIAYHISCHSMAAIGGPASIDHGTPRSDFDIGDRHGTTCEPGFVEVVVATLRGFGYEVTVNRHYAGAESIRKHADPANGIHSLQIELNRGRYMDEDAFTRSADFAKVKSHLDQLAVAVADYARNRAGR